jgi:L-ascorbate 6-phosphate lactonase
VFTLERLKNLREIDFFCPFQVTKVLKSLKVTNDHINLIHPKEIINYSSLEITGTFALPTDDTDLNHIGYILNFENGKKYYNTGDTSFTPLLSYIKDYNIDLMSICINGGYNNLSHFEAARVSKMINPKVVNPSHYDVMPHNFQPPEVFRGSLSTVKAECEFKIIEYFKPYLF